MQRFSFSILLVFGVVGGLFAGWWFGSASACGSACNFDVTLFEAIGTWLGGIGVALVVGILAWQRNQQEKVSSQAEARREATALANGCVLRYTPMTSSDGAFDEVHIAFNNKLSERVSAVAIRTNDGIEIGRDAHVEPGRGWGKTVQLTELQLTGSYANKEFAYAALN